MKSVLFASLILFSSLSFASGIAVSQPETIVVHADLQVGNDTIIAPWFRTSMVLENTLNKAIVVMAVKFHILSAEGTPADATITLDKPLILQPGEMETLNDYVFGLPNSEAGVYTVMAEAIGMTVDEDGQVSGEVKFVAR